MQKKSKLFYVLLLSVFVPFGVVNAAVDDIDMDDAEFAEQSSADAVADYQVDGSLFQQITDLEQEKVLLQLEKERAQLDLEVDKLAAEKIKLNMEIENLSGRAEQQARELETEKAKLEAEAARLAQEKQSLENKLAEANTRSYSAPVAPQAQQTKAEENITKKYRLINVFGAGNQLQATVENLSNGQSKRISVGKNLDGYVVKSISLDEGVIFAKDGETHTLNISGVGK